MKDQTEEKPQIKKEIPEEKTEVKKETSKPKGATCLFVGIGGLLAVILAIILGISAEKRFGGAIFQKFSKGKETETKTEVVPENKEKKPEAKVEEKSQESAKTTSENIGDTDPEPPSDAGVTVEEEITQEEYVLPFSNSRVVTTADLTGLGNWELKVARNEIYARHGRAFVHKDLACYFDKQPWYEINPNYVDGSLSALELKNALIILDYEKSVNSPLVTEDSGCN